MDDEGRHVNLEEINFIKVVCGIFQYCGWLGETSTEVAGFQDLHLVEGYDENPIVITPRKPTGINAAVSGGRQPDACYDLTGRKVNNPTHGIYICNGKKIFVK